MTKTMSIRMDRDNFEFLSAMTVEEQSDLSKAVRDLVTQGRILLAVERYRKGCLGNSECGAGSTRKTIAKVWRTWRKSGKPPFTRGQTTQGK